jgi:hypothetical protein
MQQTGMTVRSHHGTLKLARTIADLEAAPGIKTHHLARVRFLRLAFRAAPQKEFCCARKATVEQSGTPWPAKLPDHRR